jgi:alpha-glucosidase
MTSWWKGGVIYQIYPRSFFDTSGNGIGDLKGITNKLNYVSDLGADAIWLSPFFTSPMKDMGYDVSNYTDIDPIFGDLSDFDELIKTAHRLNLKVIIDQVLSHSSDQMPFFQNSKISKTSEKTNWYVWADPKKDGSPPNNWLSMFGGSAWEWEPMRDQYYLHNFLISQPDFNLHNAEVQNWLLDTSRFWLEKGVDGFRLDTVNYYFHDKELKDNPPSLIEYKRPPINLYYMQNQIHAINQPENLVFVERIRALVDEYEDRTTVGEIGDIHRPIEIMADYTKGDKRLHMAYSFELLSSKFSPSHVHETVEKFNENSEDSWPCWSFSNHDITRHVSRWSSNQVSEEQFAKLTAALLLSLEGTISLYQGEELGQLETELEFDELTDPPGIRFWPENKGRDGCRTPMPWHSKKQHAGFSSTKPWLPVKDPQIKNAVDVQENDPSSVLNFYKEMISFRKNQKNIRNGKIAFIETNESLLFFTRGNKKEVACIFNLSKNPLQLKIEKYEEIMGSPKQKAKFAGKDLYLEGNGFIFLKLK